MRTSHVLLLLGWMLFASTTSAQTTLFHEDFDGVTPPDPPAGWTLGDGWATDDGVSSNGSGLNNLQHSGSGLGSADTPVIDLSSATGATLSYLARRTGSYDAANIQVLGSSDGGATFPTTVLAAGSALPSTDSQYDSIGVALPASLVGSSTVVLRFEGFGLSSSSANARIDDVEIVTTDIPAPTEGGTLSFSTPETTAEAEESGIQIDLNLDLTAAEGLQGLQFRVSWDLDSLTLTGLARGPAITDVATWTLDFEAGDGFADVLLLGAGTAAIPAGNHDPILALEFAAGAADLTQIGSISITGLVSALATPEAADARIGAGETHTFTLTGRVANFVASALNLDVGMVEVGSPDSVLFTVSNPDGQTDLEIASIAISNSLFSIHPAGALIAPNESVDFYVTFSPTVTEFGRQDGEITFYHNADGDSTTIFVTAKGHSGRGDAEGDGAVDALDVVHAIDFVLSRLEPTPVQVAAVDLFPFPAGDLALDVRDLTVLTQAIARGQWPDGVALPIEETATMVATAGRAQVVISPIEEQETVIEIAHDVPIRSFQLVFPAERDVSHNIRVDGMAVSSGYDAERKELRVLAYVADGGAVAAGRLELTVRGNIGMPRYVSAIDEHRRRIRVDASVSTSAEDPRARRKTRLAPHPNPFRPDAGMLSLGMTANIRIFDILGREVFAADRASAWNGRNGAGNLVAPGLYIVRTDGESDFQARAVTVVR